MHSLSLNNAETVEQCFVDCPASSLVWAWAARLIQATSLNEAPLVTLTVPHIFLAAPLHDPGIPNVEWTIIKGVTIWTVWKERNVMMKDSGPTLRSSTRSGQTSESTSRRNDTSSS